MYYTAKINKINRDEALRYLAAGGSVPDENLTRLMDSCEEKLLASVRGRYTFKVFDIERIRENEVILSGTKLSITRDRNCGHLSSCEKAVLLAATIGADVDKLIRAEEVSDMAAALVTDAMASCAVEAICNEAEERIRAEIPEMNMTWRFSPGYGDLPIFCQKDFADSLNADREIGLFVNESFIMIPRKSVTAVIGLSRKPIEKKRRGCTVCPMYENCAFRKKGSRCTDE